MFDPIIKRPNFGKYITLEGPEGTGKTFFLNQLSESNPDLYTVLEFPNEGFGKVIYSALSQNSDEFFRHGFPSSEALFFFSMKLYVFEDQVLPALNEGKIVIEDRGVDTTALYSAILMNEKHGGEIFDYYDKLVSIKAQFSPLPDKTILLLPDKNKSLKRAQKRDGRRYNDSELEFLDKIHDNYKLLSERGIERINTLNVDTGESNNEIVNNLEKIIGVSK